MAAGDPEILRELGELTSGSARVRCSATRSPLRSTCLALTGLSSPAFCSVSASSATRCALPPASCSAGLVSEAEAGLAGGSLLDGESVTAFKAGAERMRRAAAGVLLAGQRSDFSGCLRIWEVGAAVIGPLLRSHDTPVELAGLLEESVAALARRVVQPPQALPSGVPLVVLADHGFREIPAWGRGREGRYTQGGLSLEESVVPVATVV